jgi:hypothetical protein
LVDLPYAVRAPRESERHRAAERQQVMRPNISAQPIAFRQVVSAMKQ